MAKRKKRCNIDINIRMSLDATMKALKAQAKNPKACAEEHHKAQKLFSELQKMMKRYC